MNHPGFPLLILAVMALSSEVASAGPSLYVDAAPNKFGSPDYDNWEDAAFQSAADESFVNMQNSVNPANAGTTNFEIEDEVVYSFGDLGKRLTWIYWLPGYTISELSGNFEVSLENTWDGVQTDLYDYYYGTTWLEPTSWIDYDNNDDGEIDGVIGTAGMAWWGASGVNTQAALEADLADWRSVNETWVFTTRLNGEETSITSFRTARVPEPTTVALFALGLAGIGYMRKRAIRAHAQGKPSDARRGGR